MMTRRFKLCALVTIAFTVAASNSGAASGGLLDTSFSGDGVSTILNFGSEDWAEQIAVRPDGRIVVGATKYRSSANAGEHDVAVARYRADGSPDTTFSGDGKAIVDLGAIEIVAGIASDPSGRVAIAASAWDDYGDYRAPFVARLTAAGARDTSFGVNGIANPLPVGVMKVGTGTTDARVSSSIAGVIAQPDGSLIVGGTLFLRVTPPHLHDAVPSDRQCSSRFVLVRLDRTGAIDPTFGAGGYAMTAPDDACNVMNAMARQADGSIVAAGTRSATAVSGLLVARFTPAGTPDPTFGVLGSVIVPQLIGRAAAQAVTIQPNGSILVAGIVTTVFFLFIDDTITFWRLTTSGAKDSSFSEDGVVTSPYEGRVGGVVVRKNGRIVFAGEQGSCFIVCNMEPLGFSLLADGTLDRSYGTRGVVRFPDRFDDATAIALQNDRPVVGGVWHPICSDCWFTDRKPADVAVVRLTG